MLTILYPSPYILMILHEYSCILLQQKHYIGSHLDPENILTPIVILLVAFLPKTFPQLYAHFTRGVLREFFKSQSLTRDVLNLYTTFYFFFFFFILFSFFFSSFLFLQQLQKKDVVGMYI